jgi:hypothetical protein
MRTCKNTVSSLTLVVLSLYMCSCASMRKMQEDIGNSREKDQKAFVEKKDGQIIEANEARLRSPLFGKSSIELDGEQKIPLKEVAAYQNNYAYYHTTPNGFAPRIKKGPINMYLASYSYSTYETGTNGAMRSSNHVRYVYYLQKGRSGNIEDFTPERVETYVNDYAPSMEFVEDYKQTQRKVKTWSIINTSAVFGGLILAGTVGSNRTAVGDAAGFTGLGLFLGGIVNGFVNKVRRGKNVVNLELAVDSYNAQGTKKKR